MIFFVVIFFLFASNLQPLSATQKNTQISQKMSINWLSKLFDNFHSVQRGALYRSKQLSRRSLERYIKRLGLKTIINLRGRNPTHRWWQKEQALAMKYGIKFYSIPMTARALSEKKHLLQLLKIYQSAPKPMLIHCYSGSDRTGEAAAIWVLEQQKKEKKEAFKQLSLRYGYIRSKKPAKHFLISIWQGENWLKKQYVPQKYQSLLT